MNVNQLNALKVAIKLAQDQASVLPPRAFRESEIKGCIVGLRSLIDSEEVFSTELTLGPEVVRYRDKKVQAVVYTAGMNAGLHADELKRGNYVLTLTRKR